MECHYCGRKFSQLYRLTSEDIQRERLPPLAFQMSCADCLDKIRRAANLVPEQRLTQTVLDFSLMIPLFSLVLVIAALIVSVFRAGGLSQFALSSQWVRTTTVFLGILMVWDRLNRRYGFTHDLRWSLNSKRVNVALAVVLAGIVVYALSTTLPR